MHEGILVKTVLVHVFQSTCLRYTIQLFFGCIQWQMYKEICLWLLNTSWFYIHMILFQTGSSTYLSVLKILFPLGNYSIIKNITLWICYFLINTCFIPFRWSVFCKTYAFQGICDHVRPISADLWKTHGRPPLYSCINGRNVLGSSHLLSLR